MLKNVELDKLVPYYEQNKRVVVFGEDGEVRNDIMKKIKEAIGPDYNHSTASKTIGILDWIKTKNLEVRLLSPEKLYDKFLPFLVKKDTIDAYIRIGKLPEHVERFLDGDGKGPTVYEIDDKTNISELLTLIQTTPSFERAGRLLAKDLAFTMPKKLEKKRVLKKIKKDVGKVIKVLKKDKLMPSFSLFGKHGKKHSRKTSLKKKKYKDIELKEKSKEEKDERKEGPSPK